LGTHYTGGRQTKQKIQHKKLKRWAIWTTIKNQGWTQVLANVVSVSYELSRVKEIQLFFSQFTYFVLIIFYIRWKGWILNVLQTSMIVHLPYVGDFTICTFVFFISRYSWNIYKSLRTIHKFEFSFIQNNYWEDFTQLEIILKQKRQVSMIFRYNHMVEKINYLQLEALYI
jgi:hypothetical protein